MTNLRKIGLTALAGTLAATTAHAGDLTVTGTATMEYQSTQDSISENSDSFGQNGTIVFSGSGELDNGMGVSFMQALAGGTLTSQSVALDMGDMGTLSVASLNMAGIGTVQDMVPNAGEQPWDDLGTDGTEHGTPEQGVASPHGGNRLGYSVNVGGAIVSAAMNYAENSPTTSAAIQLPNLVEGLNIGGGLAVDQQSATVENDIETYYITYSMGPISVGAQQTKVDHQTAASDIERDSYGITFAVNENLSIGYGVSDTEFDAKGLDEENTGIQASYTSGGMTIGVVNNTKDNMGGDNTDKEMTELKLTFAF
jgi:outer membrane protein OmpU